jgi:mRNA interferase MazF
MRRPGLIALFRFPQVDLSEGKLRPALILGKIPGQYDDWLICMISSQMEQYNSEFDEIITASDSDFIKSGLKSKSLIRVGRLAVVDGKILLGAVGEINTDRLYRIKKRIAEWLLKK